MKLWQKIKNCFVVQKEDYELRIISEEKSANSANSVFTIQFFSKNIFPKLSALEIAKDDNILKKFSLPDIKRILYSYFCDINKSNDRIKYHIIARDLLNNNFTIGSCINPKYVKKMTPLEIIQDKKFLLKLSKEDIFLISAEAGAEKSSLENSHLKKTNNTNIIYLQEEKSNNRNPI